MLLLSRLHLSGELTQAHGEAMLGSGDVLHHRGEVFDAAVRDGTISSEHEAEGVMRHLVLRAGGDVLRALDCACTRVNLGRMRLKMGGINREIVPHGNQRPSCSRRELIWSTTSTIAESPPPNWRSPCSRRKRLMFLPASE